MNYGTIKNQFYLALKKHIINVLSSLKQLLANHRKSFIVKSMVFGARQVLLGYSNVNYNFHNNGEHRVLEKLAPLDFKVLFDVGANKGHWAQLASKFFPNAKIHCFEVVVETFYLLEKNIQNNPNIIANSYGLSNYSGNIKLRYYPDDNGLSSAWDFQSLPHKMVESKVEPGDQYMLKKRINHIDYLKIDVEGGEMDVLEGFKEALKNKKISVIQFEYGKINIVTKNLLYDFYDFFGKHGYRVGKIYPRYVDFRTYRFDDEDFFGPNYIAISSDRIDIMSLLQ